MITHSVRLSSIVSIVFLVSAVIAIGLLASRGKKGMSISKQLGLSAILIIPCLAMLSLISFPSSMSPALRQNTPSPPVDVTSISESDSTLLFGQRSESEPYSSTVIEQDSTKQDSAKQGSANSPAVTQQGEGDVLVLPLNQKLLREMLGSEAVDAIESLNESVAPELRQAYAMIPISGLRVTPLQQMIAGPGPKGIEVITTAVSGLMSGTEAMSTSETINKSAISNAMSPVVLPDWVREPEPGYTAVTSEWTGKTDGNPLQSTKNEVKQALVDEYHNLLSGVIPTRIRWDQLIHFQIPEQVLQDSVSEFAVESTIVSETFQENQYRTHALVRLPTELSSTIVQQAKSAMRFHRTFVICFVVAACWLTAFLCSLLLKYPAGKSWFRKLILTPMLVLAVMSCLTMIGLVATGTLDASSIDGLNYHPVTCVIAN